MHLLVFLFLPVLSHFSQTSSCVCLPYSLAFLFFLFHSILFRLYPVSFQSHSSNLLCFVSASIQQSLTFFRASFDCFIVSSKRFLSTLPSWNGLNLVFFPVTEVVPSVGGGGEVSIMYFGGMGACHFYCFWKVTELWVSLWDILQNYGSKGSPGGSPGFSRRFYS